MASHAHTTIRPFDPATAVQQGHDGIADAAVITDVIARLANADISLSEQTCPTAYAWLAKELSACHERIEVAVSRIERGR